jgi:hypothetical protein
VSAEEVKPQVIVIHHHGNGLATAGFVCGLLGALLSLIPIIGMVAWVLGPLGVIFGAIGWAHAAERQRGKGLAIAGVVLGAIAIGMCILWIVALSSI